MTPAPVSENRRSGMLVAGIAFIGLLAAYHGIFGQFFPTRNNTLGHDWHWLPGYLFSYASYLRDGVPFFGDGVLFKASANPAACHAIASFSFNFPRNPFDVLAWAGASPLAIAYIQFLIFAALGYWGMLALLRHSFGLGWPAAILGAGLFMFNGFYAHRIVIGHGYFAVMLLPLITFFLTYGLSGRFHVHSLGSFFWGVCGGLAAYYALFFGAQVIIAGSLLAVLGILTIWSYRTNLFRPLIIRATWAGVIAVGLSLPILYGTFSSSVTANAIAQRVAYSLPAFRDIGDTLYVLVQMLFIAPDGIEQIYRDRIVNLSIAQQRHELEFGIGIVPLVVLAVFFLKLLTRWLKSDTWWAFRPTGIQSSLLVLLIGILAVPVIYTTNFPALLPIIKSTPIINATTSPQRSYLVFVVLLPIFSSLAFQSLSGGRRYAHALAVFLLALVVVQTASKDRSFYHNQPYDPLPVLQAHQVLRETRQPLPPIETINILVDPAGNFLHDQMAEANLFLKGIQHLGCYIPFYNSVPIELLGKLHPGSIWDEENGYLNIKNPACNAWPKENNCIPGEHFRVEQKPWVERYIRYESFPISVPKEVRFVAYLGAGFFFFAVLFLAGTAIVAIFRRRFNNHHKESK